MKVHFAGSDGGVWASAAMSAAEVKNRLFSCYKYILTKNPNDDFRLPENDVIKHENDVTESVIQDSGLFTLMFGAAKGKVQSKKSLIEWQDKLIAFTTQNKLKCKCVEIDCQKVLGVKEAWHLRERMRLLLPNKQINVFHFEDGKDGLDRLIDFSEYIAISVPELRIIKPKTYKEDTHRLAYYIKSKKPSIDIHLLGCTEFGMLKQNSFCTSCDSTSWIAGIKYGYVSDGTVKRHVNNFDKKIFSARREMVRKEMILLGYNPTESILNYATKASLCATIAKQRYEKELGKQ